ncbi:hypothetical protein JGH11_15945 [Dysgonomonas sp. Marseille-P4677]|uniref:hypothetical protein n=1 Tax=Dysgonomonas sp. Marseille-P4677 TaxID=2364790 RepID=UPI0019128645|nr:hypothetical protein [Dysgonomonas sp. Marseille-P4677]MBK5722368.1 hypothetical protein [Dysgonomonas sp. Marseille-P4677]
MKFLDYINGQRRGKDAHRIEKSSMRDPFLYEAIEGFDSIDDNHIERISNIQKRLKAKNKTVRNNQIWQTAAAVVFIVGLGGYFLTDYHKSGLHAQELSNSAIIEVYVPETYYAENITTIAQKNSEIVRAYKPNISQFRINENETTDHREELEILSEEINRKNETPIEIYVPEDFEEQTSTDDETKSRKPEPIGGYEKYNEYLKKSLRRPTDDICKDRKGKVAVEFSVNSLGQPFLFDVKYSLCGTSDNEAIRLIRSGPRWTTGTERVIVKVQF